jgi:hypothetical protein
MADQAAETIFQNDMIQQLLANGWLLGKSEHYDRKLALYTARQSKLLHELKNSII